jgi:UDP:flavonoid glycosyltransferase YjiC (YdhE family)
VAEAARRVLSDPAYRAAARRLADEAAALPPPEHAVALLERLVESRATGRGRA